MRLIDAVMRDTKYIRADLFMHRIANETLLSPSELTLIKCVMEQEPGEDVKPVEHAHWIPVENDTRNCYTCSACGEKQYFRYVGKPQMYGWEYCPHCGAKMDEEGKND